MSRVLVFLLVIGIDLALVFACAGRSEPHSASPSAVVPIAKVLRQAAAARVERDRSSRRDRTEASGVPGIGL